MKKSDIPNRMVFQGARLQIQTLFGYDEETEKLKRGALSSAGTLVMPIVLASNTAVYKLSDKSLIETIKESEQRRKRTAARRGAQRKR